MHPPFQVQQSLYIGDVHYMDIDTEPDEDIKQTIKSLRIQKKPAELYECKLIACGFTTLDKKEFEKHTHAK